MRTKRGEIKFEPGEVFRAIVDTKNKFVGFAPRGTHLPRGYHVYGRPIMARTSEGWSE
jgi:hypothetical protein